MLLANAGFSDAAGSLRSLAAIIVKRSQQNAISLDVTHARPRPTVKIQYEPTAATYAALLRLARRHCPTFSLMWREDVGQNQSARAVAHALEGELIVEERTRKWPGTEMLGPGVPMRRYRFTEQALVVLLEAPGLYAWRAPDRPEDLAFYGEDGEVWLGSIAHEREAFFGPAAPDRAEIREAVPGLFLRDGGRGKGRRR